MELVLPTNRSRLHVEKLHSAHFPANCAVSQPSHWCLSVLGMALKGRPLPSQPCYLFINILELHEAFSSLNTVQLEDPQRESSHMVNEWDGGSSRVMLSPLLGSPRVS